MRNTCGSLNTLPIAALISLADSSEWPMGFSTTIRVLLSVSPAIARLALMLANKSGAVAM